MEKIGILHGLCETILEIWNNWQHICTEIPFAPIQRSQIITEQMPIDSDDTDSLKLVKTGDETWVLGYNF